MKKFIAILAVLMLMPVALADYPYYQSPAVVYNESFYNQIGYNQVVNTRQYEKYVPVYELVPYTRYFCANNGYYFEYSEEQTDDNCFYQVVNQRRIKEYKKVTYYAPYYGNTFYNNYNFSNYANYSL